MTWNFDLKGDSHFEMVTSVNIHIHVLITVIITHSHKVDRKAPLLN